jgi:hypothetical protein|tara:strand:- start:163 stop:345 length:183 start_codon:yes stop_codon:yes gene_type:complete
MGRQIGNDEGSQVTFRKSIYGKSDGGKGARPRPFAVSKKEYEDNWDRIFGEKNAKKKNDN